MFLRVNGHSLNVVSFGAGPTALLAVGGWTGNWEVWQQPFELLTDRWRCVSFDHRGVGESPVPAADITPRALEDDILGVMDCLSISRCILAGESLGAVMALGAVLRAPERFSGLVLVAGTSSVDERVRPLIDGSRTDYPQTAAMFVEGCIVEPDSEHLKRWGRHMLLRAEPAAAARLFECYLEPPAPALPVQQVRVPTLIIHGADDAIVPVKVGRRLAQTIPGASLVELPATGHVPTVTRPRQVVDAMRAWATRLGLG